jgi:4-carboxymuconolactone decarboxylase
MVRIPLVPEDADDPDLAGVFDRFRNAGRPVPTLYRTLGNAPKMLKAWTGLAWPLRLDATTDRGLRELIIMRIAQLTDASYEWQAHRPEALHHGVTEEQLGALAEWRTASEGTFSPVERAVLALTDEMTTDVEAGEEIVAALGEWFDPGEIVELVLTAAYYACVSRTLRTLGIEAERPGDPILDQMRSNP